MVEKRCAMSEHYVVKAKVLIKMRRNGSIRKAAIQTQIYFTEENCKIKVYR